MLQKSHRGKAETATVSDATVLLLLLLLPLPPLLPPPLS